MASVEMTSKNPMKLERASSLNMTFNIAQIKADMLKQNNGVLSEKMEKQLNVLNKMDESGDGEISLMELIHLEEDKEKVEEDRKKLKQVLCAVVLFIVVMLGCMMAMGIAAIEVTKESRIRGGTPIATSGKSSSIAPKASTARRLNEPWNEPAPFEAAAPSTPLTAHDASLAAQWMITLFHFRIIPQLYAVLGGDWFFAPGSANSNVLRFLQDQIWPYQHQGTYPWQIVPVSYFLGDDVPLAFI